MTSLRRFVRVLALGAIVCLASPQPLRATQPPAPTLLDINTATPEQLASLPGMGAAYARRVIAGRPYTAKNQLVTRGILPLEAYQKCQNGIIAKHTTK